MKNKFINIARMAALPLLLAATACEDTLTAPAPGIAGDGPTLTLTLDNNEEKAGTRSELASSAPTNHVTTVRILVFQQMTDGVEPVYVGQEDPDIDWLNYNTDEQLELGERSRITYRLNYPFEKGATYTLLGVAMDANFDDDYTLDVENKTLSNAVAILKDGKTGTDIAKHEFFTGTTTFTHEGRDTHIDDLLMKRRVAGILLYVTDVPQTMPSPTNNTTNCRTTAIRLRLGEKDNVPLQQNKSVTLYRDLEDEDWTEPDTPTQQTLEGSNVLTTIDISSWTYTPNKECYMETIDGVEQIKKSTPTGLYILPLPPDGSTPTLQVDIVGKADSDGNGTPDEGAQDEVLKTLTVQNMSETGQPTAFSLRSNYIYSIGKYNLDQDIDQPISLLGEAIYLEVLPFTSVPTEHEFGEARVHALFNEEDTIYDCINQEFTVKVLPPLTTVRSSVKKITLTPLSTTYVMNNEGDFVTVEEDTELSTTNQQNYYNNWLYVKSNEGTYMSAGEIDLTNKLKDNEGCQLDFFIYDYARPRKDWGWKVEDLAADEYSWQGDNDEIERINNDIRYKELVLATTILWNNEEITKYDTLRVRQYNTITVYYNPQTGDDDAPTYCGFRRYDVYRDGAKPGDAEPQASYAWKFTKGVTVNGTIYVTPNKYYATGSLYNGSMNLSIICNLGYRYWDDEWPESAMEHGQSLFRTIGNDGKIKSHVIGTDERNNGESWYLPAQYEMEGLMIMASYNKSYTPIVTNIHPAKSTDQVMFWYWTSTLPDDGVSERQEKAIAYHYIKEDNVEKYESTSYQRTQTAFIRQARRFPEEYQYGY